MICNGYFLYWGLSKGNQPVKSSCKRGFNRRSDELGCRHDVLLSQGFSVCGHDGKINGKETWCIKGENLKCADAANINEMRCSSQVSLHLVKFVILYGLDHQVQLGIVLRGRRHGEGHTQAMATFSFPAEIVDLHKQHRRPTLTLEGMYLSSSSMPRGMEISFWKAIFILSRSPMAL